MNRRSSGGFAFHRRGGEPEHQVAYQVPVDHVVDPLVAVGEQAVVAGAHAAFLAGAGLVAAGVRAGFRVEVHDLQCGAGRLGQCLGVIDQAPERPGAAFRALYEQGPPPPVLVGEFVAGQLAVFELEGGLDAAFQGDGGRDGCLGADRG